MSPFAISPNDFQLRGFLPFLQIWGSTKLHLGVEPKIGRKHAKMNGLFHGKPYWNGWFGGPTPIFWKHLFRFFGYFCMFTIYFLMNQLWRRGFLVQIFRSEVDQTLAPEGSLAFEFKPYPHFMKLLLMAEIRRSPVDMVSLSHYLHGFRNIPGGDRRISEPSTVR